MKAKTKDHQLEHFWIPAFPMGNFEKIFGYKSKQNLENFKHFRIPPPPMALWIRHRTIVICYSLQCPERKSILKSHLQIVDLITSKWIIQQHAKNFHDTVKVDDVLPQVLNFCGSTYCFRKSLNTFLSFVCKDVV